MSTQSMSPAAYFTMTTLVLVLAAFYRSLIERLGGSAEASQSVSSAGRAALL